MNDSTCFDRYDTGIMSLADLFRHDRLPCRAEPKRRHTAGPDPSTRAHEPGRETTAAPATAARP